MILRIVGGRDDQEENMSYFKTVKQFITIMNQENQLWRNNNKIQEGIIERLRELNSRVAHLEKMIGIRK